MNEKKAPDALSVRLDGTAHELTGDNIRAYLSGKGLAALAAVTGGDDMRHYCEYLKAHGFYGDPFQIAAEKESPEAKELWALRVYQKFVTDDHELRAYMLDPDTSLVPFDMEYVQDMEREEQKRKDTPRYDPNNPEFDPDAPEFNFKKWTAATSDMVWELQGQKARREIDDKNRESARHLMADLRNAGLLNETP